MLTLKQLFKTFKHMNKLREWILNFMKGRYGTDSLSMFLLIFGIIIYVIAPFIPVVGSFLFLISLASVIYSLFRVLSKDTAKRQNELRKYQTLLSKFKSNSTSSPSSSNTDERKAAREREKEKKRKIKEKLKTHDMFYCPECKTSCYVPKGRGKVRITCPKCGNKFLGKT